MVVVAVLLLPSLGLMLFVMTRIEDRVLLETEPARHVRRRHLRVIQGGKQAKAARHARPSRHVDAA